MYYLPSKKPMFFRFFLSILLLLATRSLLAQPPVPSTESLLAAVRSHYSGDSALAAVAFVGQRWRLPGNRGFDESIYYVRDLLERAGFREEGSAEAGHLTYRLERRPLARPAWEPVDAALAIAGEAAPLLRFATNRNMVAINSFPTPPGGVRAEVVYIDDCRPAAFESLDLRGKIAFGECACGMLFEQAVRKRGALGVLGYRIPAYNQPEKYRNSIPFTGIALDTTAKSWAINLSYAAKETLKEQLQRGSLQVEVKIDTRLYSAEELALVAEIAGGSRPEERFVFSAHVQEPGANDNASGVGCLAEMARVAARLTNDGQIDPQRTLTFLWGDEITSTRRFVTEDEARRRGIRWGVSLDMVGENTALTGGTFLIEKMPDPSAIWTRGDDRHTEWGAARVSRDDLRPHFFNDFILDVCRRQAATNGWIVNTNPFEGGSDHVPFLQAGIPGLLLWHFTDVFYHTDADRLDKVSPATLHNVGVSALAAALTLTAGDEAAARQVLDLLQATALERLEKEFQLSKQAIAGGADPAGEHEILKTWAWWYEEAAATVAEIPVWGGSEALNDQVKAVRDAIRSYAAEKSKAL